VYEDDKDNLFLFPIRYWCNAIVREKETIARLNSDLCVPWFRGRDRFNGRTDVRTCLLELARLDDFLTIMSRLQFFRELMWSIRCSKLLRFCNILRGSLSLFFINGNYLSIVQSGLTISSHLGGGGGALGSWDNFNVIHNTISTFRACFAREPRKARATQVSRPWEEIWRNYRGDASRRLRRTPYRDYGVNCIYKSSSPYLPSYIAFEVDGS